MANPTWKKRKVCEKCFEFHTDSTGKVCGKNNCSGRIQRCDQEKNRDLVRQARAQAQQRLFVKAVDSIHPDAAAGQMVTSRAPQPLFNHKNRTTEKDTPICAPPPMNQEKTAGVTTMTKAPPSKPIPSAPSGCMLRTSRSADRTGMMIPRLTADGNKKKSKITATTNNLCAAAGLMVANQEETVLAREYPAESERDKYRDTTHHHKENIHSTTVNTKNDANVYKTPNRWNGSNTSNIAEGSKPGTYRKKNANMNASENPSSTPRVTTTPDGRSLVTPWTMTTGTMMSSPIASETNTKKNNDHDTRMDDYNPIESTVNEYGSGTDLFSSDEEAAVIETTVSKNKKSKNNKNDTSVSLKHKKQTTILQNNTVDIGTETALTQSTTQEEDTTEPFATSLRMISSHRQLLTEPLVTSTEPLASVAPISTTTTTASVMSTTTTTTTDKTTKQKKHQLAYHIAKERDGIMSNKKKGDIYIWSDDNLNKLLNAIVSSATGSSPTNTKKSRTYWTSAQNNILIKYCIKNLIFGRYHFKISWTNWSTEGIQDIPNDAARVHLRNLLRDLKGITPKEVTKTILETMIVLDSKLSTIQKSWESVTKVESKEYDWPGITNLFNASIEIVETRSTRELQRKFREQSRSCDIATVVATFRNVASNNTVDDVGQSRLDKIVNLANSHPVEFGHLLALMGTDAHIDDSNRLHIQLVGTSVSLLSQAVKDCNVLAQAFHSNDSTKYYHSNLGFKIRICYTISDDVTGEATKNIFKNEPQIGMNGDGSRTATVNIDNYDHNQVNISEQSKIIFDIHKTNMCGKMTSVDVSSFEEFIDASTLHKVVKDEIKSRITEVKEMYKTQNLTIHLLSTIVTVVYTGLDEMALFKRVRRTLLSMSLYTYYIFLLIIYI